MNKNITQPLKLIALALILSVGISYVSAWTSPTVTPPNGNVSAPINVSSNAQIKTGDLSAWALISNSVVTNALRIPSGALAGKVLTSDASGNATWQVGTPGPQGPAGVAGPQGPAGPAGSSGTGITGVLYPLRNKTISCVSWVGAGCNVQATSYLMVDGSGYPYARVVSSSCGGSADSGWVLGYSATVGFPGIGGLVGSASWSGSLPNAGLAGSISNGYSASCSAVWPWM